MLTLHQVLKEYLEVSESASSEVCVILNAQWKDFLTEKTGNEALAKELVDSLLGQHKVGDVIDNSTANT